MMKEGKRSRAPQALEILTGAVSVDSLSEIIRPVAHVLVISYNPGRVNKLVTLLHHVLLFVLSFFEIVSIMLLLMFLIFIRFR